MAEVNFNSIYDGVSLALHAAFPAAQVHGGNVKQGLKPGDFNVIMPGAGHAKEVGQRYKRTPTVDVIYYPKAGDAECYGMAHRLSFVLGSITTPEGDIIHATGCEWTLASRWSRRTWKLSKSMRRDKPMAKTQTTEANAAAFTKAQLVASQRYVHRRDLIGALLEDSKTYTLNEVDALIEKFMKGKVR